MSYSYLLARHKHLVYSTYVHIFSLHFIVCLQKKKLRTKLYIIIDTYLYNNNHVLYNLFRRHLAKFPALKEDNPAIGYTDGEDILLHAGPTHLEFNRSQTFCYTEYVSIV